MFAGGDFWGRSINAMLLSRSLCNSNNARCLTRLAKFGLVFIVEDPISFLPKD
jgi:hypothetical protein